MYSNKAPEENAVIKLPMDFTIKYKETFLAPASGLVSFCFCESSTTRASPITLQKAVAVELTSTTNTALDTVSTQKDIKSQQIVTTIPNIHK